MGKGYRHGVGGVSQLNYAVVAGTTRPENPRENTIWVNMSTKLADYTFGDTAPESPVHGSVWICVGSSGTLSFNALKKNCILLRPVKVYRYIITEEDGETIARWDEKEAEIYQNGEWVSWESGNLFTEGNLYSDLTGGWTGVEEGAATLKATKSDDSGYATYGVSCQTNTVNAIDLSLYSTLAVTVVKAGTDTFTVWVQNSAGTRLAETSVSGSITDTVVELDISNVNEACYVYLYAYGNDYGNVGEGTSYASAYLEVSEVKLG